MEFRKTLPRVKLRCRSRSCGRAFENVAGLRTVGRRFVRLCLVLVPLSIEVRQTLFDQITGCTSRFVVSMLTQA